MIKRTITTNMTKLIKISKFGFSNCTSLVSYGTYLGSTVYIGRFSVNLQQLISLPSNHYSIVVSKQLSDGWLEKYSSAFNTRLIFKQFIIRADYVIHSFMTLYYYCSSFA
jgi:hypothetical protein